VHSLEDNLKLTGSQGPTLHIMLRFHPDFHNQYNTKVDVGFYAPTARTILNPGVFPVFIRSPIKRS
jgi:hypothetical protein